MCCLILSLYSLRFFLSSPFFLLETMLLSISLLSFSSQFDGSIVYVCSFDKKNKSMSVMPNIIETINIYIAFYELIGRKLKTKKIAARHLCTNSICVYSQYRIVLVVDTYLANIMFDVIRILSGLTSYIHTSSLMMIDCHFSCCCLDRLLTISSITTSALTYI
jgi:hypothetical protein